MRDADKDRNKNKPIRNPEPGAISFSDYKKRLLEERDQAKEHAKALEADLIKKQQENSNLNKALKKKFGDNYLLYLDEHSNYETATSQLAVVEKNYETATSQLAVVEKNYEAATSQLAVVEKNYETATSQLAVVEKNYEAATSQLTVVEKNYETSQAENQNLQQQVKNNYSLYQTEQEKYQQTLSLYQAEQVKLSELQVKFEEVSSERDRYVILYNDVKKELKFERRSKASIKGWETRRKAENQRLKQEIADMVVLLRDSLASKDEAINNLYVVAERMDRIQSLVDSVEEETSNNPAGLVQKFKRIWTAIKEILAE